MLGALELSFAALAIEVLLEFDDLMGQLFYFLLVDVWEIVDVGVVEFLDRFSEFSVYVYQLLQRSLQSCVLLVEKPVLLPQVLDVCRKI